MSLDYIKLSKLEKDQLSKLKRYTGIDQWNVLCRWAFNVSLKEVSKPPKSEIKSDSNVEMTWKIFAGEYSDLYLDLLKLRCAKDGLHVSNKNLYEQFRLHLKRGIGYLAANKKIRSVEDLMNIALCKSFNKTTL